MSKNYCIFRTAKLKSHKDIVNVLKEQQRADDYDSKRADKNMSFRNSYSADYEQAQKKYDELLPKKNRKNAVVGLNFLVSTSEEFSSLVEENRYYEKARLFISQNFGEVVGWAIHRDETSTHMQVVTIPLVNGKLNARQLIGGDKHRLQKIQSDFYEQVGKSFGLERGEENSQAVHKTVEQKHKEKERELNEREKRLSERENGLVEREKALNEQETRLTAQSAEIAVKKQILTNCIQETNKNIAELNKVLPTRNFDRLSDLAKKVITGVSSFAAKTKERLDKWLSLSPAELRERADKIERSNCRNWQELDSKKSQSRSYSGWER